jgi:replication factor A1
MDEFTKVKDLNQGSKRVTVLAKVLNVGEAKQIQTRYGEQKSVTEAVLGDETGKVTMSLWNEQASQVETGDSVVVENGYVSFVRGHMRLNVGKYGAIKKAETPVGEVNESLDMSEKEYQPEETDRRPRRNFSSGNRNFRSRY